MKSFENPRIYLPPMTPLVDGAAAPGRRQHLPSFEARVSALRGWRSEQVLGGPRRSTDAPEGPSFLWIPHKKLRIPKNS